MNVWLDVGKVKGLNPEGGAYARVLTIKAPLVTQVSTACCPGTRYVSLVGGFVTMVHAVETSANAL